MTQRLLDSAPWLIRPRVHLGLFALLGIVMLSLAATIVYVTFLSAPPQSLVQTSQSSVPEPASALTRATPTQKAVSEPDPAVDPAPAPTEPALVPAAASEPELVTDSGKGVVPAPEPTTAPQLAEQPEGSPAADPGPSPDPEPASPPATKPIVTTTTQTEVAVSVPVSASPGPTEPTASPTTGPVDPGPEPTSPDAPEPADPEEPSGPVTPPASGWKRLPANGSFDYQIGGDYSLPSGTSIVSRDWFSGQPAAGAYSICYINAFQTQADGGGNRPDELSRWPSELVLRSLGDDPNWAGEFLIDLSSGAKRVAAAQWLGQMIDQCAAKGFDAVEFDNLDSWTRFSSLPFGQSEALAYAKLITDYSHSKGLAVGQKNTAEIISAGGHRQVGFDFAIAESCGQYNECDVYARGYGNALIIIEYDRSVFNRTCSQFGADASVVLRDVLVRTPNRSGYVYEGC